MDYINCTILYPDIWVEEYLRRVVALRNKGESEVVVVENLQHRYVESYQNFVRHRRPLLCVILTCFSPSVVEESVRTHPDRGLKIRLFDSRDGRRLD